MRAWWARHRGQLLAGGVLVVALAVAGYVVGLNVSADYAIMLVQKYTWQPYICSLDYFARVLVPYLCLS